MPLQALLFDLDDTLLVEYASADEAFHQACLLAQERYGIHADRLHETARRVARSLWHAAPGRECAIALGISSWEALWAPFEKGAHPAFETLRDYIPSYRQEVWRQTLAHYGIHDAALAERMAHRFQEVRRGLHIVYPDVHPTLSSLAPTYRLGLVTNGLACLQRYKFEASGLQGYFQTVIIAGEIGIAKPAPAVFEHALDHLGVHASDAVMIGNSLRADIAGAQQVGLRAIWLNRMEEPVSDAIRPDVEIKSLLELPQVLAQLHVP